MSVLRRAPQGWEEGAEFPEEERAPLQVGSEDPDDPDEDEDELSTLYDFIEVCVPGPSRRIDAEPGLANPRAPIALDDEDDDREEEEDLSAGEVIFTDEKVRREWLEGRNGTTKLGESMGIKCKY